MTRTFSVLEMYKNAAARLDEALALEKTDIVRDSAIMRFELCADLSWKLLKEILQEHYGVPCYSPKWCYREAFKQGILGYDDAWLEIVDLRNETVHVYDEKGAERVYQRLPAILQKFKELLGSVTRLVGAADG